MTAPAIAPNRAARRQALRRIAAALQKRQTPASLHPKQRLAFETRATELLYGGAAGGGKALALDTPIPTPDGWTTMGALRIGDAVFDERGRVCRVIAATDVMHGRPCYRVRFSDGADIVADAEHQWWTTTVAERQAGARHSAEFRAMRRARRPRRGIGKRPDLARLNAERVVASLPTDGVVRGAIRTTREIAETLRQRGRANHAIPVSGALALPEAALPIPPYVLGAWLGDGHTDSAGFTTADAAIITAIEADGFVVRKRSAKYAYGILGLQARLRQQGLLGHKHIPDAYLRASEAQRLALLQGLMDTDGSIRPSGQAEFTTTSPDLADGTVELLRSLGIKAQITTGVARLNGVAVGPKYRIKFTTSLPVFRLPRKAARLRARCSPVIANRMVESVEPIASVPVRCIQVDTPSHLFLAGREMVPTHNSHLFREAARAWCKLVPGLQVYLFRREFGDLYKNHMEGTSGFPAMLAEEMARGEVKIIWSKNQIRFLHPGQADAVIHLCHCQHEKDVYGYQGAEIHVLMIDELTQWTRGMYTFLRSRVRLGGLKVPKWLQGLFPRILNGANPGGIGHTWVKASFIDIASEGSITPMPLAEGGMQRQFIRARLEDNPSQNTAEYEGKLEGIGDPALAKAMRHGDWDIVAGGFLDDVWDRDVHVVKPFPIPATWELDRSFDWGDSSPFSVGWWAESDGTTVKLPDGREIHTVRGDLFRVGEWYGWNGTPNEGQRLPTAQIAKGILQREREWFPNRIVKPGPADSSIFSVNADGYCIADLFRREHVAWEEADKSPGSRVNGAQLLRERLVNAKPRRADDGTLLPRERPGLFVFDACTDGFIRTVPVIPRDKVKRDDVDTKAEDHAYDESRYRVTKKRYQTTVFDNSR